MTVIVALVVVLVSCDSTFLVSGQEHFGDLDGLLEEVSARLDRLEAKLATAEEGYQEDYSGDIGEMSAILGKYTPYEP